MLTEKKELADSGRIEILTRKAKPSKLFKFYSRGLVALGLVVALVAFILYQFSTPPAAVPTSAPASEFSSARAIKHLQQIAYQPHPTGSAENVAVRDYLIKELNHLGLNPQIQTATGIYPRLEMTIIGAGKVTNVMVRIPGTASSRALLLMAHYDSVPTGPGFGDDGVGIATLLETLRAVKAGPPLKNDVIFLFTDGEEIGLLGAESFVTGHPWVQQVGLVLNFEGGSLNGFSLLESTSAQSGWLVEQFARVVPYPMGNSFGGTLSRLIGSDNDLTPFQQDGLPGMEFDTINRAIYYHSMLDNASNGDERTLQNHGLTALALARHFGNLDLEKAAAEQNQAGNAIYFNLIPTLLVQYSESWALPLALLVVVAFGGVVILDLRKKKLTFKGLILGSLTSLVMLVITSLLVHYGWELVRGIYPQYQILTVRGDTYNSLCYLLAFLALALALSSVIYLWFTNKFGLNNLIAGSLVWWLFGAIGTSLALPGLSYLFVWPSLFTLLGIALVFNAPSSEFSWWRYITVLLCTIPGIVLFTSGAYIIFTTQGIELGTLLIPGLFGLQVGLLLPLFNWVSLPGKSIWSGLLVLVAVIFLVDGALTAEFNPNHPKPNSIAYILDTDTNKAQWISLDGRVDEWTDQFFAGQAEKNQATEVFATSLPALSLLTAPAPLVSLAAPQLQVLSDQHQDATRTLQLLLTSPRQASQLLILLDPATQLVSARLDGRLVTSAQAIKSGVDKGWVWSYAALPREGVELTLEVKAFSPIRLKLLDHSEELPVLAGFSYKPRPAYMIPVPLRIAPFNFRDATFVGKSFVIDAK